MNYPAITEKKLVTGTITRIIDKFEASNPIKQNYSGIIKNYIYVENRRIIS